MTHKTETRTPAQIWTDIHQAIASGDDNSFLELNQELIDSIKETVTAEQEAYIDEQLAQADQAILAKRGGNTLTKEETTYYQKLGEAMSAKDVKQAITNLDVAMPRTIIERVGEDLKTKHPLLSKINFRASGAITRTVYSKSGKQVAVWGELCDEIVKELTASFAAVETNLYKLSAFLPVCKQALKFGPHYLDKLVRDTLYDALANALEEAIVNGTGKDQPIGMTRQVGTGVTVTDGVYPKKAATAITDLSLATVGSLIDGIASDDDGADRDVKDLLLVCNSHDYYTKVVPATMILTPSGEYRSILPYDIAIVPVTSGLERGEAVFGLGYRYAAFAGSDTEGNIDYSDHARYLQDQRVYLIKAFANGFPMDNHAFSVLDISGLEPAAYPVKDVSKS